MTLKEISEKTGFSITTISRVMNRTGYVNEETYRKVMQAAEEGGYFQKKKNTALNNNIVGVIVPDLSNPFFRGSDQRDQRGDGDHAQGSGGHGHQRGFQSGEAGAGPDAEHEAVRPDHYPYIRLRTGRLRDRKDADGLKRARGPGGPGREELRV